MTVKSVSVKAPMSIYYWAKALGLAPFTLKNNTFHPVTLLDILYPVLFATAFLIKMSLPILEAVKTAPDVKSQLTRSTVILYSMISDGVSFFTLITWLLKSKEIVHVMNRLCLIHNEINSMGIDEDLEQLFKNIFVTTVTANTIIGTICLVLIVLEPFWSVHLSIAYTIQEFVRLNTFLIFVQILLCISKRFRLLNRKFYEVFELVHRTRLATDSQTVMTRRNPQKDDREYYICKMEVLHLKLSGLVDKTNRLFGIPILLNTLSFMCELVLASHWIYYIGLNLSHHEATVNVWSTIGHILCPILRMGIVVIEVIIIAYATATICQQGNATKIVLFRVWNKFTSTELMDEFFMFSLQLLHKPVAVAAFGFFHLDYSYLYKIFCAMVAYLIIMIQLDTSHRNFGT